MEGVEGLIWALRGDGECRLLRDCWTHHISRCFVALYTGEKKKRFSQRFDIFLGGGGQRDRQGEGTLGGEERCLPDGLKICERVRLVLEIKILITIRESLVSAGKAVSLAVGNICGCLLRLLLAVGLSLTGVVGVARALG